MAHRAARRDRTTQPAAEPLQPGVAGDAALVEANNLGALLANGLRCQPPDGFQIHGLIAVGVFELSGGDAYLAHRDRFPFFTAHGVGAPKRHHTITPRATLAAATPQGT